MLANYVARKAGNFTFLVHGDKEVVSVAKMVVYSYINVIA